MLTEDVGDGEFSLKNCEVGEMYVNGGGANSVHIANTKIKKLSVNKKDVRIALDGNQTEVEKTYVFKDCKIESENAANSIASVVIADAVNKLNLAGAAKIESIVSNERGEGNTLVINVELKIVIVAADSIVKDSVKENNSEYDASKIDEATISEDDKIVLDKEEKLEEDKDDVPIVDKPEEDKNDAPVVDETEEDYTVEGPWTDVTSIGNLLGTWHHVDKCSGEGEKDGIKWSEECKEIVDWEITKDGDNYICKQIIKAGNYESGTSIYTTPLTEEEFAAKKAELEDNAAKENNEYEKFEYSLTKDELVQRWEQIKDEEVRTCSLKIEEGKCYFYRNGEKEYYIKINEIKNGIQIFREYEEEPRYTCKKL